MADPSPQHLYTPQALEACEKALRTILTKVGPWGGKLLLIAGMAPKYIVGNAPMDMKEHVGTTDLDVVVGVPGLRPQGKCPPQHIDQKAGGNPVLK